MSATATNQSEGKSMRRTTAIIGLLAVAMVFVWSSARSGRQADFAFSHRLHISDVGLACEDCHGAAATAQTASVNLNPPVENCTGCHEAGDPFVVQYAARKPRPDELIFSHEQHVTTLGMDCATCHAGIERAEKIPTQSMPPMALCVDCHTERKINDACAVCHTHVEWRLPEDHGPDWVLDHVEVARQDGRTCETCHQQSYCQECHDGAALGLSIRGLPNRPASPIGELATAHQGRDLLTLQRVHNLNYRYTHGTDVRAKTSDCAVCHETVNFCAACHNPETDIGRRRPVTHDLPGFRFSTHAIEARNDIERCASCHDPAAAEPTCLQCHRTTVSPHPDGFMQDVKGPWHEDRNAVCYVCHDNRSRVTGVGFCSSCHAFQRWED